MANPRTKSPLIVHSASDILAAGGPDAYAKKAGINTQSKRISGVIRLSKEETLDLIDQLSHQK